MKLKTLLNDSLEESIRGYACLSNTQVVTADIDELNIHIGLITSDIAYIIHCIDIQFMDDEGTTQSVVEKKIKVFYKQGGKIKSFVKVISDSDEKVPDINDIIISLLINTDDLIIADSDINVEHMKLDEIFR